MFAPPDAYGEIIRSGPTPDAAANTLGAAILPNGCPNRRSFPISQVLLARTIVVLHVELAGLEIKHGGLGEPVVLP